MKFPVEIPDEVFWQIAAKAEQLDMKVPDLAADLLRAAAIARTFTELDPVLKLWRQGLTDKEIARALNCTNAAVAGRRQRHRLPANRRRIGD